MSTDMKNYRIGVDVGDRSVGLAAIEFDDAGFHPEVGFGYFPP